MRAMSKKKHNKSDNTIARNRRARFDYHLEDTFEAGVELRGWEVKSLRMGKADISDSYVMIKSGEAFLLGTNFIPLDTVSTHYVTEPDRTRKLLLHAKELAKILVATQQKGLTCVAVSLYWKGHLVKAKIALARGKQDHDKRATDKDRDWERTKQKIVRDAVKQ
jgi:SsrA-binding protein